MDQKFNPQVACGYLGPCGFLPCILRAQQRDDGGRVDPRTLRTKVGRSEDDEVL